MLKVKIRLKEHSLVNKIRLDLNMLEKTLSECFPKYLELKKCVEKVYNRDKALGKNLYEELKKLENYVYCGESLKEVKISIEINFNEAEYCVEIVVNDFINLEKEFNEAISEFKNMVDSVYGGFCLTKLKVVGCDN